MDGSREAAGAIAGMIETYGPRFSPSKPVIRDGRVVDTWAVGDYVAFSTEDRQHRQGYILEVVEDWGFGKYRIKSHRVGGGQPDIFDVDGVHIHIW